MIIIIIIIIIIIFYYINKEPFETTCPNGQILVDTTCKPVCTSTVTTDCVDVSCPPNYTFNINTNKCESKLSFDTCLTTQTLINGKCYDQCTSGYIMNPNTGACIQPCISGYTIDFSNNTCYKVTSFDACLPTQTLINGKCYDACITGYSTNPYTGTCVQNCISGYTMDFSNNICYLNTAYDTCQPGQTRINDKCYTNCLSGYVMNKTNGTCVQSCLPDYTMNLNDYKCYKTTPYDICLSGQTMINSKCYDSCISGYIMNPNTGACVQNCAPDYTMNFTDNSCYKVTPFDSCQVGQTKIGTTCYTNCLSGYIMNPNTGACIQQCAPGYTMDFTDNSCYKVTPFDTCPSGQTKITNKCYTNCISGYIMNPNTGTCVQQCPTGYTMNFTDAGLSDFDNKITHAPDNSCYRVTPFDSCLPGQTKIGTSCYTNCISGYVMNPNTGTCVQVCPTGYTMDFSTNTCYKNSAFDICLSGQTKIGTKCYTNCLSGYIMNPNTGTCIQQCAPGYTMDFTNNTCYRVAPFDICLSGQTKINDKCYTNCISGYIMNPNTGTCVQQCAPGYTIDFSNNTCIKTISFDICSVGQTMINSKCYDSCISGYIMNPNTGVCVQTCASDYTMNFDDNKCYKTTSFDICLSGQTKIGTKCFDPCISGYIMNPNTGTCVHQCTTNFTMDFSNNTCYRVTPFDNCATAQIKIANTCYEQCPVGYVMNPNTGACIQSCISGYVMNFNDNKCYKTTPYNTCSSGQTMIGTSCYTNCISGYIMNPNTGVCVQKCTSDYTMDFNDNKCYKTTIYDTCLSGQTKIGALCYTNCISGYIMNPNTGTCVQQCASGYTMNFTNNSCYKVTPFDACLSGQTKINNSCYSNCLSGYIMNPNTGTCVQQCATGYTMNFTDNSCYKVTSFDSCLNGETKIGTSCYTNCLSGYIMNPNTGTCVQQCASGYTMNFTDNSCYRVTPFDICLSGQTKIGTKCYTNCLSGYVMNPNTGTCLQTCAPGYTMDFSSNTCNRVTPFDICLSGQTRIGTKCFNPCLDLSGYVMNPNTGACVQQCASGYTLNFTDNSCYRVTSFDACPVGQTKIGTSCYASCLSGYIMNPYTGACVQTCPSNYTMNFIDNTCYKTTSFDTCLPGQTKIGSKCFDNCISGYIMNPNTGTCVQSCPSGYNLDFNDAGLSEFDNKITHVLDNTCNRVTIYDTCLSGQTKIGSKCFDNCISGYEMNPNTGVCVQTCAPGYTMNINDAGLSDFDNKTTHVLDNTCYRVTPYDTCLPGQTKIGSKCFDSCISGYIMNPNTGTCVQQCPIGYNMNFDDAGLSDFDNTCYRVTPFDTCLPGQTNIGSKCFDNCLSGYIMNPNTGACIQACETGYTMNFNDNKCYKTTPFDNCSNGQVLINNKCFDSCNAGYTMNPNTGACVQDCPAGQLLDFNTNSCYRVTPFDTCLSGQIKIGNNCFNSCADGYMMNPNTGACLQNCATGYTMNFNDNNCYKVTPYDSCSSNQTKINNKCYNNCSTGYTMNPNTGACVQNCPTGYNINFNDNKCYRMS